MRYKRDPSEPLLPPEPKTHCACCNQAAPMVESYAYNRNGWALTPRPHGWMRSFYPWSEDARREGAILESQWLCPPCAGEVAKFIAHRRTPMICDEDLVG